MVRQMKTEPPGLAFFAERDTHVSLSLHGPVQYKRDLA